MIEERFAQGNSFFHRRDPRGKIAAAMFFTATVALIGSPPALLSAFAISLLLLLIARVSLIAACKRLLLVNSFTLFLWITLPLTYGGQETLHLGSFSLSWEGIRIAAVITLKTNTILPAIIALLATSTVAELGHALDKLHFPRKLVFILLYSYRYVFVIHQEYNRLLRAAKIRSFSPGTNLHTYKTFAYLFGMTLVKSYNRSHRVHQAMLLRGFSGKLVSLQSYSFRLADILFVAALLIFSLFLIVLTYCGGNPGFFP